VEVRPRRDGRITIPAEFRRELGIGDETTLRLTVADGELRLRPVGKRETDGASWFKELYDYFAPARQEAIEKGYTDEEINGWIDQAVAEVRAKHG
jgi:AbrB family looped-hinge helix DNA binding protein